MSETSRNFAVGLTTIAATVGFCVLMLLFGYVPKFLEEGYLVTVELDSAGGLYEGSRVSYSGIDIGRVETVDRVDDLAPGVVLTMMIDAEHKLPDNVYVSIEQTSLLAAGGTLTLRVPDDEAPSTTALATDGSAMLAGEHSLSITDAIAELAVQFGDRMDSVVSEFTALSQQWTEVGENLAALSEPTDPDAVDAGDAIGNLSSVLARADQRMAELEPVLANIEALFGDEQLNTDLREAFANARDLTASLQEAADTLQADVSDNLEVLTERYVAVADDMAGAIMALEGLIRDAQQGEGTFGRLMQDPSLYENLDDSAERLQRALDELSLTLQKWSEEGVPLRIGR